VIVRIQSNGEFDFAILGSYARLLQHNQTFGSFLSSNRAEMANVSQRKENTS
jgi:hypothetical protein